MKPVGNCCVTAKTPHRLISFTELVVMIILNQWWWSFWSSSSSPVCLLPISSLNFPTDQTKTSNDNLLRRGPDFDTSIHSLFWRIQSKRPDQLLCNWRIFHTFVRYLSTTIWSGFDRWQIGWMPPCHCLISRKLI